MKYTIAICDDNSAEAGYLAVLTENWAAANGHYADVRTFDSAEAFLFFYEEDKLFDILLLDIQMKEMDGVALAKEIRLGDERMQIVFVTGFPDFIAEGYEVTALHYLMKPVGGEKLSEVLGRAASRLQTEERSILFPKGGGSVRIPAADILYAEAFPHHAELHTKKERLKLNLRFSDLEKLLGEGFFRCHRSYIVAIEQVRRVTRKTMILENALEIPLSRSLYEEANRIFIRYR